MLLPFFGLEFWVQGGYEGVDWAGGGGWGWEGGEWDVLDSIVLGDFHLFEFI